MKLLKRPVYAGISGKLNPTTNKYKFSVDFETNTDSDIIKFIQPYFHKSTIDDNTYWFGYVFNDGQASDKRDQFIEYMKHVQRSQLIDPMDDFSDEISYSDESITQADLDEMILRSLNSIHLHQYDIDCIVYPQSNSGNLVSMIARCIRQYASAVKSIEFEELQKASPADLEFDYSRFAEDCKTGTIRPPEYVTDEYIADMMRKARMTDSFSIRKYIKPVLLRNYVSNFYAIDRTVTPVANAQVILVVDDFGTTGTTIREIIRNIRKVNTECEIYVFTLMGKNKRS